MTANKDTVYQMVTDRIIEKLEAGTVPWRMPWRADQGPANLVSGKAYRGINVFLLGMSGYTSRWWLTFKQAQQLGGTVRKGEHGTVIVFWQMVKVRKANPDDKQEFRPLLRYYRVFNLEQTDGVRIPKNRPENGDLDGLAGQSPQEAAEVIVAGYPNPPTIREGESQAWYRASEDLVNMPNQGLFNDRDEWYATLFHELGHSTGHPDRLDRLEPSFFGSHDYGREELVAEMTAAFLAAEAGITSTQTNNAAYLASWIRTIREDVRAVVVAAGKAQKAADHILGREVKEDNQVSRTELQSGNKDRDVLVDA